jgi:hypothetical protein
MFLKMSLLIYTPISINGARPKYQDEIFDRSV